MKELLIKLKQYLNMESEISFEEFKKYYSELIERLTKDYNEMDQTARLQARYICSIVKANAEHRAIRNKVNGKAFKKMAAKCSFWVEAIDYRLQKEGMTQTEIDSAVNLINQKMEQEEIENDKTEDAKNSKEVVGEKETAENKAPENKDVDSKAKDTKIKVSKKEVSKKENSKKEDSSTEDKKIEDKKTEDTKTKAKKTKESADGKAPDTNKTYANTADQKTKSPKAGKARKVKDIEEDENKS